MLPNYGLVLSTLGMTDYYRDRVRQGGILSNNFIHFWWSRQVGPMQYGNGEKVSRAWGSFIYLHVIALYLHFTRSHRQRPSGGSVNK